MAFGQWALDKLKGGVIALSNSLPQANNPFEAAGNIIGATNKGISNVGQRTGGMFYNTLTKNPVTNYFKPTESVRLRDILREVPSSTFSVGRDIQTSIGHSFGSTGLSLYNLFADIKDPTGKSRISEYSPTEHSSYLEKMADYIIFGKDSVKSVEKRMFTTYKDVNTYADTLGDSTSKSLLKKSSLPLSVLGVGGMIGLDFTGYGGEAKTTAKMLAKMDDVVDTAKVLRGIGVAEDLVLPTAKKMAKITEEKEITKALEKIDWVQKNTKVGTTDNSFSGEINLLGETQRTVKPSDKLLNILSKDTPKITPKSVMETVAPKTANKIVITSTDKALLKQRVRAEARGAKVGFRGGWANAKESITNQLRSTWGNRIEKVKRKGELKELRTKIISRDADRVKTEIVDYVKQTIPLKERGKYINLIKNATTQRDVIKAFSRVDAHAETIMKSGLAKDIQKKIVSIENSKNVDVTYVKKIKEIVSGVELKGHTAKTLDSLSETKKYLEAQKAQGVDVHLPSQLLKSLDILGRTPKNELTIPQLQGIHQKIELLESLGKLNFTNRKVTYMQEANVRKSKLLEDAVNWSSKPMAKAELGGTLDLKAETINEMHSALNLIKSKNLAMTPMDGVAKLTGMEYMKDDLALSLRNFFDHELKVTSQKIASDIVKKYKLTDGNFENIDVYAAKMQKDGYAKLETIGISKEEADAIKLTEGEQALYNYGRKVYDETLPEIQAFQRDVYNKPVDFVENYTPFITDHDAFNELELWDRYGTLKDVEVRTKTVQDKFTKSRTGAGSQKIRLNFYKNFIQHTEDVSYMVTMGRDIKMYTEIINKPEMVAKMGDVSSLAWKQWLDLMARKGGTGTSSRIDLLDKVRRNTSVGVMGFKLSSSLVQLSSFADGASLVGAEHMFKGSLNTMSKDWRKFVLDNFPEIREGLGDDPAFLELGASAMAKLQKAGMKPLTLLDGLVRTSTASGAYEKLMKEAGLEIDLLKPNQDILLKAQKIVNQTQGSSGWWNQPLAISKGTLTGNKSVDKFILQFQSFALGRWYNMSDQIWYSGLKKGADGERDVKGAANGVFWLVIMAGALEMGLRDANDKIISTITGSEEPEDKELTTSLMQNTFTSIPLVGNLINAIVYQSNPIPSMNILENAIGGVYSTVTGKDAETKEKGAARLGGAAGALLGIPGATQAADLIKKSIGYGGGAYKVKDKELESELKRLDLSLNKPSDDFQGEKIDKDKLKIYSDTEGKVLMIALEKIVKTESYQAMSDYQKEQLIKSIQSKIRTKVGDAMFTKEKALSKARKTMLEAGLEESVVEEKMERVREKLKDL